MTRQITGRDHGEEVWQDTQALFVDSADAKQ